MGKVLTLDLGTTYFKAAVFDEKGELVALRRVPAPVASPAPGRFEIDPAIFGQTLTGLVRALPGELPGGLADVQAVTFATQTNSFLLLDAHDRPLTPIILWTDQRATGFRQEPSPLSGMPFFGSITGLAGLGPQFMVAKLRWVRACQPDVWKAARHLCLLSDWFTHWLTGLHITEAGAAGLTGLLDIRRLQWWPPALEHFELKTSWLPEVARAGTDLGPILPELANQWNLPPTCRFIVGCLDQYAGAIGAGNVAPGGVSETTGTVLASIRCTDRPDSPMHPAVFQGPGFAQGLYYRMAFGSISGNLLEAYRNHLPDRPDFAALDREAARVPPGAQGLRLRADADPGRPAELFQDDAEHFTRGHRVRAILEAVAFALARQIEELCPDQRPQVLRCVGGAARSSLWLQIKADVLNCPVAAMTCPESTSLGVAILGASALAGEALPALANQWARPAPPHLPDPHTHQAYRALKL